jgi:hypothetical protein
MCSGEKGAWEDMALTEHKERRLGNVTPCDSCKNRRFGGTYCLHHQGEENYQARNSVNNE